MSSSKRREEEEKNRRRASKAQLNCTEIINIMLFGTSHSIRRAREARRRARLEERKRQKIMRTTFSLLAFVGIVIAAFSVFELRRMKIRYEAAAAVAKASRITQAEFEQDVNTPNTASEPGLERLSREGPEFMSQHATSQSSSQSQKHSNDNYLSPNGNNEVSAKRNQQSDETGTSRGTDEVSKIGERSGDRTGETEQIKDKSEVIEDVGTDEGTGPLMDSLGDEEGGNGPIITLADKNDSSTEVPDSATEKNAATRITTANSVSTEDSARNYTSFVE